MGRSGRASADEDPGAVVTSYYTVPVAARGRRHRQALRDPAGNDRPIRTRLVETRLSKHDLSNVERDPGQRAVRVR